MTFPANLHARLYWINLPAGLLIVFLQRTPVMRLLPASAEFLRATPFTNVLRSSLPAAAMVGGVNTLAGATELSTSQASPANLTVGTQASIAFSITGTPSAPEFWTTGGTVPPGMTYNNGQTSGTVNGSTLILSGTPTTAGTFSITVRATDSGTGSSTDNFNYTINVSAASNTAPAITTQPASQTVTAGASVTFTAAASGNPAPTFQWRKDGTNISGATNGSFSIASVAAGDAGTYTVVATNSAGSATSNGAVLTVNAATAAPAITTQPASQTVTAGASVTFTAAASGNPAPTFQWRKDGTNISGATNSSFSIASVTTGDAGTYTVVATNSAGSATSNGAVLTVNAATVAPAITTQPASQTVTAGASVTFTAAASGNPAPTFQWRKDGTNISGATNSSFSIASVVTGDAGTYTVVATNSLGTATSNGAVLTVSVAASHQVRSITITTGHGTTFSAGSSAGAIQWQISTDGGANWTNLSNDSTYSGVTTNTLRVANAGSNLNGAQYRFVATNSGVVSTSNAATLTVAQAFFPFPSSLAVDTSGNVFVGDSNANTIQRINSAGQVSSVAGSSGTAGSADGNGSTARFNQPGGVALLPDGTLIVADSANATVRSIAPDGTVTTIAGSANMRGSADGAGAAATFSSPMDVARDAGGNLYVADAMNNTIRRISSGTVSTFAGTAGATGTANGNGAAARFNFPTSVAVDSSGRILVADTTNNTIRAITSSGDVSTIAGLEGVTGFDDGTGIAALFNRPGGLAVDGTGNIFVADTGNSTIRRISPAGTVTTLAGTPGVAGLENGTGTGALFNQPKDIALDASGNLFVADTGNAAIRRVTPQGVVTLVTLTAAPPPPPPPPPPPAPTPNPPPSGGGGGGGGGGAPSIWFLVALGALAGLRRAAAICRP